MLSISPLYRTEKEQGIGEGAGQNRDRGSLQLCVPSLRLGSFTTARKSTFAMCSRLQPWAWKNSAMTRCYSFLKPMESSEKVKTCQCWPPALGTIPALWQHLDAHFQSWKQSYIQCLDP